MNKIGPGQNFIDPRQNSVGQTFNLSEYGLAPEGQQQPIDTILSQAVPLFPIDSLKDAKQAWATLAYTTVKQCFKKEYGKITIDKSRVEEIINFWQENPNPPAGFENVPSWTLVRTQTLSVLKVVKADMDNVTAEDIVGMTQYGKGDSLVEILMRASTKIPYSDFTVNGYQMLESMSSPGEGLIKPHEAILASLLTPHRQWALPTCPIDALINQETCNNPAALAKIFLQLLESQPGVLISCGLGNWFSFINQQIVASGHADNRTNYIIIIPELNRANLADIYDITPDVDINNLTNEQKRSIIADIQAMFEAEGITVQPCIVGGPRLGPLQLQYPIHNLTDVLFANMMQHLCAQGEMCDNTRTLHENYYGAVGGAPERLYTAPIARNDADFDAFNYELSIADLQNLQDAARRLQATDPNRHLAAICTAEGGVNGSHVQNLYLDTLAEVPNPNPYYIIGDRNYTDDEGKSSLLAVRRVAWDNNRWEFIEVTEPNVAEPLHFKTIDFEP